MPVSRICRKMALLASSVALALLAGQALADHSKFDRIVAFGASLTDTGNAFVLLGEAQYANCGDRLSLPPYDMLDDLLVPDGPYARGGHHFSNGDTWVEGLARSLALAGNVRPALQSGGLKASNYAAGGARAVEDNPCRFNLPSQLDVYLSDFPQTSARTLVAIEIGGNDVRDALADPANAGSIIHDALTSLGDVILTLHATGANHFLVLNVPDIGKTPAVRMLDLQLQGLGYPPGFVIAMAGGMVDAYNGGLAAMLDTLNGLPGMDIRLLDIHATLNDVIANPGANGFANATDACVTPGVAPFVCTKPDTYVFWDGTHPTKALHAIVAQRAISVVTAP